VQAEEQGASGAIEMEPCIVAATERKECWKLLAIGEYCCQHCLREVDSSCPHQMK